MQDTYGIPKTRALGSKDKRRFEALSSSENASRSLLTTLGEASSFQ